MSEKNKLKHYSDYTKLRCLMLEKGYKQCDLAEKLNMPTTRLSTILTGGGNFTPMQINIIMNEMHIPESKCRFYFFNFVDGVYKQDTTL